MFLRIAAMTLSLGLTGQAAAASNKTLPQREICRQSTPLIRDLWSKGTYDAPPAVARLMLDAIDGKLPEVRQQLHAVQPADAVRWRQLAMLTAVWTGQATVVDGLLDDGAAVDAKGWIPPFKPGFFGQTVDAMQHDARFGGPVAVKGLMTRGLVHNQSQSTGPALIIATECGDLATLNVLLRHHASIVQSNAPNEADALTMATIDDDAPVARLLLNHGADPCASDRRLAQAHLKHSTMPAHTLAQIGSHAKLPTALVARLTCPVVAATH